MAIFYKYYSYLPLDFFDEPTLKITSPKHLNDPFEALLPSDIDEYIQQIAEHHTISSYTKSEVINTLKNTMILNGIISFSETQRNLLMWAHYANDHKGLCIGYESDELLPSETKKRLRHFNEIKKVNYDSVRHESFGEIDKIKSADELHHYILSNVMLTKGDSWIYEKEHRYIIPTNKSDYVKVKKSDVHNNPALKNGIDAMISINAMRQLDSSPDDEYIIFVPGKGKQAAGFGYLNERKEASYFLRINPRSIRRIYFGCRTPNDYIQSIKARILTNPKIHKDIYINTMQLDKNRFELHIPPLTNIK